MKKYNCLIATFVSMVMLMIILMFVDAFGASIIPLSLITIVALVLYDDKLIKEK